MNRDFDKANIVVNRYVVTRNNEIKKSPLDREVMRDSAILSR